MDQHPEGALGERRAVAVKTYLVSIGIAPDRVRTVSYGKEFPFDPGHYEAAWSQNRRAHFADPMMSVSDDPLEAYRKTKLYNSREGAAGGDGTAAGGGCGCQ